MEDVCGEDALKGWHQESCRALAAEIDGAMTDDAYSNREEVDTVKLCRHFWGSFLGSERERVAAERAEREAEEEKKKMEEAAANLAAKKAEAEHEAEEAKK